MQDFLVPSTLAFSGGFISGGMTDTFEFCGSSRAGAEFEGVESVADGLEGCVTVLVGALGAVLLGGGFLLLFGLLGAGDALFAEGRFESLELRGRHGCVVGREHEAQRECMRLCARELFLRMRLCARGRCGGGASR